MRPRLGLALAGVVLAVAACSAAPRDFVRPDPGTLQLGKSKEEDITARFGEPQGVTTRLVRDRTVTNLSYSYAKSAPEATRVSARVMVFSFADGVLVGHQYLSSFSDDTTDFDEARVAQITRGRTTAKHVIELFGRPGGEFIHPLAKTQDGRAYVYNYSLTQADAASGKLTTRVKTLIVNFDPAGIVSDVDLSMSGK